MRGRLLEQVLNYGVNARGQGAYLHRCNAYKVADQWMIKNKPLILNKTYTVAISDYLLKGLDIPFLTNDNQDITFVFQTKINELAYDIRKVVITYLQKIRI